VNRTCDPTVRAIEDALAFTTAAVAGDVESAMRTARQALVDTDGLFLDALVSTVQLIADEAVDGGVDVHGCLRDVALGVQIAHLSEGPRRLPNVTPYDPPNDGRS
jgi:hypothetical protein